METGSDLGSEPTPENCHETLNLTLDFEHAHVSGHPIDLVGNFPALRLSTRSARDCTASAIQSAAALLTRPETALTLPGAARQIAAAETRLSPIDSKNAAA